jgi:hypothetical protein
MPKHLSVSDNGKVLLFPFVSNAEHARWVQCKSVPHGGEGRRPRTWGPKPAPPATAPRARAAGQAGLGRTGSARAGQPGGTHPAEARRRGTAPSLRPENRPERKDKGRRSPRCNWERQRAHGRRRGSVPCKRPLLWILMVSGFMAAAKHLHAGSRRGAAPHGFKNKDSRVLSTAPPLLHFRGPQLSRRRGAAFAARVSGAGSGS